MLDEAQPPEQAAPPPEQDTQDRAPASVAAPIAAPGEQGAIVPPATDQAPAAQPYGHGASIPQPNYEKSWESGDSGEGLTPKPTKWDEFVGGVQKGTHDGAGVLYRLYQEAQAPQGQQLPADQANKLYPGRPVPYTTPVNENIARMEFEDRQKQAALDEWMGRRDPTWGVQAAQYAGGLTAGLTNPLNVAATLVTGGIADAVIPAGAPFVAKLAAHFLGTWTDFSAIDKLQNVLDTEMGAKPKTGAEIIGESAVPAAGMTAFGVGMRAAFRAFVSSGEATPENVERGVKSYASALANNEKAPMLEQQQKVLAERKAGAAPDGTKPTLLTGPVALQESTLHAAVHSDGSPLIHEHGLGPGAQLTDTREVANNGVSRSGETPGQLAETKLPPESQLLNIDKSAAEDYNGPNSLLKAIEKSTGISLEGDVQNGESLKQVIQKLGDWAGAEVGDGKTMPEDILQQVQDQAKSQGYSGYEFAGENSRQAHVFDASALTPENPSTADPSATPALPDPKDVDPNPATERLKEQGYSPDMAKIVHDFHKAHPTLNEYDPANTAQILADAQDVQKQLQEISETSASAKSALESLREQDAQDKRLAAVAQKIVDCGSA